MPTPDEEAELEQSKMSFGEHLEELRTALIKSILALTLGFCVGLLFGSQIVAYIQTPLKDALERHFQGLVQDQVRSELQILADAGEEVPANLDKAAEEFAAKKLVPHVMYVDPASLAEALQGRWPDEFANLPLPDASDGRVLDPKQMLRLQVYQPLSEDPRLRVVGLGVEEPFMIYLKASFVAGAVFASPFVFYYLWQFVAAGMYRRERTAVYTYMPISIGLFTAGAALAFFVAFTYMLNFLFWFYKMTGTDPDPRLSYWMSVVLTMPLGFGIAFQLPLVMLALERLGIFTIATYVSKWRIAVLIICTISVFLTPADLASMFVMAVPLIALYFGGILLCKYMPDGKRAES